MTSTLTQLLPALAFLASTAGAGWLAQALFTALRRALPRPTPAAWRAAGVWRRLAYQLLYAPRVARGTVFALAAGVAVAASVTTAALSGQAVMPALDAALAVVVSQALHAARLPATVALVGEGEPQP